MKDHLVNKMEHIDISKSPESNDILQNLLKEIEILKNRIAKIEKAINRHEDIKPTSRNTGYGFMLYT